MPRLDIPCPCCEGRISYVGTTAFALPSDIDASLLCGECVEIAPAKDLPPFAWPTTAAEIEASTAAVLSAAEANLASVAAAEPPTFASVIAPLMAPPNYKTNPLVCQSKFLAHSSTAPEVRAAAEAAGKAFAGFKAASRSRADVFAKVQAFAATAECAALGPYERHFVDALLSDFERGGLALGPADRAELQRLLDADAAACAAFGKNLGADTTALSFTPDQLEGLPAAFVVERSGADGRVRLTLKYPDLVPVLGQCEVEATRRALTEARETAYGDNLELVATGIGLRKQTAALLGYDSWAHHVIERRMAGSPEAVVAFMGKVSALAAGGAAKDHADLLAAKVAHLSLRGELPLGGAAAVELFAWDSAFYSQRILKLEHGVDTEAVRQYFPLDHVVGTTLSVYQELLGLTFTEMKPGSFPRWHPDVRLFVVHDAAAEGAGAAAGGAGGGRRVGHFYLDLHPREGKYGHAAIFHLLKRRGDQTAVDCMLCNLPAPSRDGTPALLRHGDVVTFFHEFGHIMHGLCSEGEANSTRLAKCPRDFVEAPSQMLENWCWQPAVVARLSRHVETGAPLPAALLASLVGAKNVHASTGIMRQVYLATLDLEIHGHAPPADAAGLQALVDRLRPQLTQIPNPAGGNMLRSFGHLMNQYSAAYYGYMWAEVISADMFATRFEADCMSAQAGAAYRKQVLAPGGTGRIMTHLAAFLGGREPSQEPFLKARGIL